MAKAVKPTGPGKEGASVETPPKIEKGNIDGKNIEVLVIDEIADDLKPTGPAKEGVWVRLRDGGSCWGFGNTYFIANRQARKMPKDSIVQEAVNNGTLVVFEDEAAVAAWQSANP